MVLSPPAPPPEPHRIVRSLRRAETPRTRGIVRRGGVDGFDPAVTPPELVQSAQLVRFAVQGLDAEEIAARIGAVAGSKAKLLAQQVDDYDTFELCKRL